jgi:hypothetical protein
MFTAESILLLVLWMPSMENVPVNITFSLSIAIYITGRLSFLQWMTSRFFNGKTFEFTLGMICWMSILLKSFKQ